MTPLRGLTDPVGPESPQIYWVRRLMLLVVVVVVVALVIAGIAKLAGGSKESAAPAASSFTPDPSWTDTAWASATPSASSSAVSPSRSAPRTESPSPSALASTPSASSTMCEGSQLSVKVTGDTKKPHVGDTETFTVEVSSSTSCHWDTQKVKQTLTVTSGSDRIWSTDDCGSWGPKGVHEIKSKNPWTYKISWPTKRSTGKCKLSQESLGAGYYVATVNIGGGPSGRFVMRMGA